MVPDPTMYLLLFSFQSKCLNRFNSEMHWLVINTEEVTWKDAPTGLRLDSNFYTVDLSAGWNGTFPLVVREWYRIKSTLYQIVLGTWSEGTGGQVPEPDMWERRKDLHGISLVNYIEASC